MSFDLTQLSFDGKPYCTFNSAYLPVWECNYLKFLSTIDKVPWSQVSILLLILIIVISLFGGIKEHYRWFVLNQALWDLIISYDFLCENNFRVNDVMNPQKATCFYTYDPDMSFDYDRYEGKVMPWKYYLGKFINECVSQQSYASLLLLTFTRFLCLYFMHFYKELTNKRRIYFLIMGFNLFFVFTVICQLVTSHFISALRVPHTQKCQLFCKKRINFFKKRLHVSTCNRDYQNPVYLDILWKVFTTIAYLKAPICLLLSILAAGAIAYRIGKQMSFQLQHNRKDFMGSLRVTIVLLLQTTLNIIIFVLESWKNYYYVTYLLRSLFLGEFGFYEYFPWAQAELSNVPFNSISIQIFRQCRVFIESVIILGIMTGYREAIFKAFGLLFRVPKKFWLSKDGITTTTKVTDLSSVASVGKVKIVIK